MSNVRKYLPGFKNEKVSSFSKEEGNLWLMTSVGEQGYHEKGWKVMESGEIFNLVAATDFKM